MEGFWKAAATVLLTVILALSLGKQDLSILLTLATGCMVAMIALSYLEPVLEFLQELELAGELSDGILNLLLKAAGVALASEIIGKLCADAGNASLGKSMEFLGSCAVLYLSIPILESLLTLIRDLLGAL